MKQKIEQNEFLGEVRKIFPNATSESIMIGKLLRRLDFCYCYGEVTIRSNPKDKAQIELINSMARRL